MDDHLSNFPLSIGHGLGLGGAPSRLSMSVLRSTDAKSEFHNLAFPPSMEPRTEDVHVHSVCVRRTDHGRMLKAASSLASLTTTRASDGTIKAISTSSCSTAWPSPRTRSWSYLIR